MKRILVDDAGNTLGTLEHGDHTALSSQRVEPTPGYPDRSAEETRNAGISAGARRSAYPVRVSGGSAMAPQVRLELTTLRLTAECSTIELLRNVLERAPGRTSRAERGV